MRWILVGDGTLVQGDRGAELSGPYDDDTVTVTAEAPNDSVAAFDLDRDARVAWIGWLVKHTKLTEVEAMALDMAVRRQ